MPVPFVANTVEDREVLLGQRGISADRGSRMFGSQDQSDDARTGNSGKDVKCGSHGLFLFVHGRHCYQNQ